MGRGVQTLLWIYYNITGIWDSNQFFFILITMAHCYILLASALQLLLRRDSSVQALLWTVWYLKVCGRSMVTEISGWCDRLEDMYEFGCGVYSAQFRMLHMIAKVQRDPFISARKPSAFLDINVLWFLDLQKLVLEYAALNWRISLLVNVDFTIQHLLRAK